MRRTSTQLIFPALVSVYATPVHADPYRWCADYGAVAAAVAPTATS